MSSTSSTNTGAYSKPAEFEDKNSPNQKWYDPEIGDRLPIQSKEFYETYTGVAGDDLTTHLHRSVSATHLASTEVLDQEHMRPCRQCHI